MKKGFFKLAAVIAVAVTGFAFTHDHELCNGFVPENSMKIPVGHQHAWGFRDRAAAGLTQAEFNEVIDRAERLYGPVVQKAGGTLKFNRRWTDETVNASAQQSGTSWIVNMYGGLARHPAINKEGFALVVCHELGHHIGGAPKIQDWWGSASWATNEGGSDYFATLKCLRNFFAEDDNESILSNVQLDPFAKSKCEAEFTDMNDQMLCLRNTMAATSVAYLFMDLRKEKNFPKFDSPDPKVAKQMDDNHPATQCRMDTYFAGAVCRVDKNIPVSSTDYREGSCVQTIDTNGWRPLCWFKP